LKIGIRFIYRKLEIATRKELCTFTIMDLKDLYFADSKKVWGKLASWPRISFLHSGKWQFIFLGLYLLIPRDSGLPFF
jgi:hypothetical protein